jgi:hypothetical protein
MERPWRSRTDAGQWRVGRRESGGATARALSQTQTRKETIRTENNGQRTREHAQQPCTPLLYLSTLSLQSTLQSRNEPSILRCPTSNTSAFFSPS